MIKQESIESLKSIINVVDIIGNYIQLKRKGSNFVANCPFHSEKTPSFVVSPSKQIYHCFGCGVTGDAIKFLMDYENISYPEAVEKIASLYNFKLEYSNKNYNYEEINVLEKVNQFYIQELIKEKKAYNYLLDRGIQTNSIEKFGLGFAPSTAKQIKFLEEINVPLEKAIELGVLAKGENGVYARLIDRITFPIFSANNRIIAYGGRTISNHPAKYINYSNTKLFNKSKSFYGLNFAREKIIRKREIIITEGYIDVIMLHQAGYSNAVAVLGTSLTSEHLPMLKKMECNVLLAYDGDKAGINAAFRSASLLLQNSFEGGIVLFPEGKDAADMIKNGEDLESFFSNRINFSQFIIEKIKEKYNFKSVAEKERAVEEIRNFLNSLPDLIKEEIAEEASQLTSIPSRFFKIKQRYSSQTATYNKNPLSKRVDPTEASIIKTLYENRDFINDVAECLTPEMFNFHQEELRMIYQEEYQNPKLIEIVLNEEIKVIDYNCLFYSIKIILSKFLEKRILEVKNAKEISLEEKAHKIKKLRAKIVALNKGEIC
jgi:DNA primase